MPSIRVPAFAKVNLRLDVLARRADGYHELRTIFQSISLHDTLHVERSRKPGIELQVLGNPALAAAPQRENLVWRAADAFASRGQAFGRRAHHSEEAHPGGTGVGRRFERCRRSFGRLAAAYTSGESLRERLLEIAAGLGADVPFFLFGGRALGTSRGDEIYPLPDGKRQALLVVSPRDIAVSTRDAYGWLDRTIDKGFRQL